MAFTVRIDGADAEALQRQAARDGRSVEDVAREVIRDHVSRLGRDLASEIAAARSDADLDRRLSHVVERDKEILDRLAE